MSQFQITTIVAALVVGVVLSDGVAQVSDEARRLREEFLRTQEQKPKVTRSRPANGDSASSPRPSSSSGGRSRYGYQGTTPKPASRAPQTVRPAARPAPAPARRYTPPAVEKSSPSPQPARPSPRLDTTTKKRYTPPSSDASSRKPPASPRPSAPPAAQARPRPAPAPSSEYRPPREPETPFRDRLRNFADRLRELPKTEQAGGYVEPSERIEVTPPAPKTSPPKKSKAPKVTVSNRKAGPPSPASKTAASLKPPSRAVVNEAADFVKSTLPGEEEMLESFARPLRISPPNIEGLTMPPALDPASAPAPVAEHEEKIESMLPRFSPAEFTRPEVEMAYVQAAPLDRSAATLFDFAVKHFVRIPVNQPVKTSLEEKAAPPPPKPAPKETATAAVREVPPPPPVHDGEDPLNGFTITSLHQTDFNLEDSQMVFSGDVFCESPEFQLSSDEFIVHLRKDMKGMSYGEAKGNVVITTVKNGKPTGHTGYSRHAIYRPDQDNLILSGWPRIRYNGKEHVAATAETQMILGTDGAVKTLGRSKTRFVSGP